MSKIRVVLIEDHDLTRFSTKVELQRSGWVEVVGEAANACNGLQVLARTQPDIAIVDIDLPDMNGIELVRQFKVARPEVAQTRILMLTLQNTVESVQAAIAAGADSYCIKTSSRNDLLTALQMTHRGHSWLDPEIAPHLGAALALFKC